ncbi:hypothetical protein BGZ97_009423 [Linnemannia gamsii]|uniref:CsbD-like domain-containing protein n=1 Tax=Linnemannia gamsii TaxID=64522 RepID=A0A9P6R9U6_9FUNG|nr:hypothetical protein BGZ97_009423 [Linnemannia gamsii]
MTDRLSNTASSYIGGAKQSIGETIGNTNLASSGAQQKAQADAALKAADAKTHAEGLGHKVQGEVQQNVGSLTGNTSMEARGDANETRGNLERKTLLPKNMTDRLANSTNAYIGAAKQAIGNTIGNTTLASSGAQQQSQAEVAQKAADAKTHAQGAGHNVEGQTLTGNAVMEARGNANEVRGDIERQV